MMTKKDLKKNLKAIQQYQKWLNATAKAASKTTSKIIIKTNNLLQKLNNWRNK